MRLIGICLLVALVASSELFSLGEDWEDFSDSITVQKDLHVEDQPSIDIVVQELDSEIVGNDDAIDIRDVHIQNEELIQPIDFDSSDSIEQQIQEQAAMELQVMDDPKAEEKHEDQLQLEEDRLEERIEESNIKGVDYWLKRLDVDIDEPSVFLQKSITEQVTNVIGDLLLTGGLGGALSDIASIQQQEAELISDSDLDSMGQQLHQVINGIQTDMVNEQQNNNIVEQPIVVNNIQLENVEEIVGFDYEMAPVVEAEPQPQKLQQHPIDSKPKQLIDLNDDLNDDDISNDDNNMNNKQQNVDQQDNVNIINNIKIDQEQDIEIVQTESHLESTRDEPIQNTKSHPYYQMPTHVDEKQRIHDDINDALTYDKQSDKQFINNSESKLDVPQESDNDAELAASFKKIDRDEFWKSINKQTQNGNLRKELKLDSQVEAKPAKVVEQQKPSQYKEQFNRDELVAYKVPEVKVESIPVPQPAKQQEPVYQAQISKKIDPEFEDQFNKLPATKKQSHEDYVKEKEQRIQEVRQQISDQLKSKKAIRPESKLDPNNNYNYEQSYQDWKMSTHADGVSNLMMISSNLRARS